MVDFADSVLKESRTGLRTRSADNFDSNRQECEYVCKPVCV